MTLQLRFTPMAMLMLLLALAPLAAQAQEAPPEEAPTTPTLATGPQEKPSGVGSMFGSDMIRRFEARKSQMTPDGLFRLVGRVTVEGEALMIQCDQLTATLESQELEARGQPVRIQFADETRAECRNFFFDQATGIARLEGESVIYRRVDGLLWRISGDIITISRPEDGEEPSINVETLPDSNYLTEWVVVDEPATEPLATAPANTPTATPQPGESPVQKINGDNLGQIPIVEDAQVD